MEFSKSTWPAFIEKLQDLVQLQQNESHRAIYGSGDYILANDLAELHIDHGKWQSLTVKQKESHIQKMITAVCSLSDAACRAEKGSVEQLPINSKSLLIPTEKKCLQLYHLFQKQQLKVFGTKHRNYWKIVTQ